MGGCACACVWSWSCIWCLPRWSNFHNSKTFWHYLLVHKLLFKKNLSLFVSLYSASQKKRNRESSMFYHNLITIIINKWHIFGKLRPSSFIWCNSYNAYFTHEWFKWIWREETKNSFGGRYLNFKEKIIFLENWVSALSYGTSIRKNELGITKFCLFKVVLAFP